MTSVTSTPIDRLPFASSQIYAEGEQFRLFAEILNRDLSEIDSRRLEVSSFVRIPSKLEDLLGLRTAGLPSVHFSPPPFFSMRSGRLFSPTELSRLFSPSKEANSDGSFSDVLRQRILRWENLQGYPSNRFDREKEVLLALEKTAESLSITLSRLFAGIWGLTKG